MGQKSVEGLGLRIQGDREAFEVWGSEFRGLGKVEGLWLRVQEIRKGLGLRVKGLEG